MVSMSLWTRIIVFWMLEEYVTLKGQCDNAVAILMAAHGRFAIAKRMLTKP